MRPSLKKTKESQNSDSLLWQKEGFVLVIQLEQTKEQILV